MISTVFKILVFLATLYFSFHEYLKAEKRLSEKGKSKLSRRGYQILIIYVVLAAIGTLIEVSSYNENESDKKNLITVNTKLLNTQDSILKINKQLEASNTRLEVNNDKLLEGNSTIISYNKEIKRQNIELKKELDRINENRVEYNKPSVNLERLVIKNMENLKEKYKIIPSVNLQVTTSALLNKLQDFLRMLFHKTNIRHSYSSNSYFSRQEKPLVIMCSYKNADFCEDLLKALSPLLDSDYKYIPIDNDGYVTFRITGEPYYSKEGKVTLQ